MLQSFFTARKKWALVCVLAVAAGTVLWRWGSKMEFMLGGAMITLGYHLQDRVQNFDFDHEHATPQQVWTEFLEQNRMSSFVRSAWPRTNHHPEVILVTCMDGRLDTNEIAGDTREYYYVLRLAGSVLSLKEEEMLELAVANGTKLVVFTTHSDCAAEKVAGDPARRPQFPNLSKAVDERQQRFEEFLTRDMIREKTSSGHLLVKWMDLDTRTERLEPHISSH